VNSFIACAAGFYSLFVKNKPVFTYKYFIFRWGSRVNGMILFYLDIAYAYVFPEYKLENPDLLYAYIDGQHKKI